MKDHKKEKIVDKHFDTKAADTERSNAKDADDYVTEVRDKGMDMENKKEYRRQPGTDPEEHSRDLSHDKVDESED